METPPPTPSPWEPLRRLSRWPLRVLMAFLGLFGYVACRLAFALAPHGTAVPAVLLVFVALCALGILKAYRFGKALAERQADPTNEALAEFILEVWVNRTKRAPTPEEGWLAVRPRLRLIAIAGISTCACVAIAYFGSAAEAHQLHFRERKWIAHLALGGFAVYGAGVFFELFRCAWKLSQENTKLTEAMEHYRRFHNHGLILAFGVSWALFCSLLTFKFAQALLNPIPT
jgi:hypothetical protein